MEHNINKALGIDKMQQPQAEKNIDIKVGVEKTLIQTANFILTVGIIASVIMLFTIVFPEVDYTERKFSMTGFLITVGTCVSSIATWAVFRVISNISINLFEIKSTIKK